MRYGFLALILCAPQDAKPGGLTVHEWGTFTTVAGEDGASIEWRPLAESSDLPSFVYGAHRRDKGLRNGPICKSCGNPGCDPAYCQGPSKKEPAFVRMETPVLYFYCDREMEVSVDVQFPQGRVTEWYPQARRVDMGIDWGRIKVLPGASVDLPREAAPSHYYPARETDAAPVRVCGKEKTEIEKFLFYRGIGSFALPLRATPEGVRSAMPIAHALCFENHGGKIRYGLLGELSRDARPWKTDREGLDGLVKELERMLVDEGLFEKEARAMIQTWRDSWFEEGVRVFYLLPRRATDEILPLRIEPKPASLVRVMVGRVERLTPEMEKEILSHVERLGDESFAAREAATKSLARYGRFLEPVLKRIRPGVKDAEIRDRIDLLLSGLK